MAERCKINGAWSLSYMVIAEVLIEEPVIIRAACKNIDKIGGS